METVTLWLERHRWKAGSVAGVLVALYVLLSVGVPRLQQGAANYQRLQQHQANLQAVAQWPSLRTQVQVQRAALQRRYADLYVSLPQHDDMASVLEVLQTKAREVGISLRHVRPGPRATHARYDALPFDLELSGTYHRMVQFLASIEQSRYLFKVVSLAVEAPAPSASAQPLEGTLVLQVSTLKE